MLCRLVEFSNVTDIVSLQPLSGYMSWPGQVAKTLAILSMRNGGSERSRSLRRMTDKSGARLRSIHNRQEPCPSAVVLLLLPDP
jgi:hypothetical protein